MIPRFNCKVEMFCCTRHLRPHKISWNDNLIRVNANPKVTIC